MTRVAERHPTFGGISKRRSEIGQATGTFEEGEPRPQDGWANISSGGGLRPTWCSSRPPAPSGTVGAQAKSRNHGQHLRCSMVPCPLRGTGRKIRHESYGLEDDRVTSEADPLWGISNKVQLSRHVTPLLRSEVVEGHRSRTPKGVT